MTDSCSGVAKWQGREGAQCYGKPSPSTVTANGADENRLRDSSAAWRPVPQERDGRRDAATTVGMTGGCLLPGLAGDGWRAKPAERFFAAWRRIPRNGMRGKTGRHFVSE